MAGLRSVLLGMLATLPLAVSAATVGSAPAGIDAAQGSADVLDRTPPARCDLADQAAGGEDTDAKATGCCWLFYNGRYWCVPCDG
jgi:hypothetical protein